MLVEKMKDWKLELKMIQIGEEIGEDMVIQKDFAIVELEQEATCAKMQTAEIFFAFIYFIFYRVIHLQYSFYMPS